MNTLLEVAAYLQYELLEFALGSPHRREIDGFVVKHPSNRRRDIAQNNLLTDLFITEVPVSGNQTLLDLFIASRPDWSPQELLLLNQWSRTFLGLFEIREPLEGGLRVMNWLSARVYAAYPTPAQRNLLKRFKPGDIVLTRLSPLEIDAWVFSGPCVPFGNLSKPKLAVAIDNFRRFYRSSLYADAPELLEQAWESVARQHEDFITFFGADEVTIPGPDFNTRLAEFHDWLMQRQAASTGIDINRSLAEMATTAGVSDSELAQMAAESGLDTDKSLTEIAADTRTQVQDSVKLELPSEMVQAEQVTAFSDPRWGQVFVPNYFRLLDLLTAADFRQIDGYANALQSLLRDPIFPTLVWQRAAQQYPQPLEAVLRAALERPQFELDQLPELLQEFGKPSQPELPETASAPAHLSQLFQEALATLKSTADGQKAGKKKKKKSALTL